MNVKRCLHRVIKESEKRNFVYCWQACWQITDSHKATWGVSFSAILMATQTPRLRLNVDCAFLICLGNTPLNLICAINADCEIMRLHIRVWLDLASMLMLSRYVSFVLRKVTFQSTFSIPICFTSVVTKKRQIIWNKAVQCFIK